MERMTKKAHGNVGVDPFVAGSPHGACMHARLGARTVVPDVGASPIFSVGDGVLLHGIGAGASASSIGVGAGAGTGSGSSGGSASLGKRAEPSTAVGVCC
jgi:hypothetical protein